RRGALPGPAWWLSPARLGGVPRPGGVAVHGLEGGLSPAWRGGFPRPGGEAFLGLEGRLSPED
ncbi:MAG: hypothetical protein LBL19_02165, partial [Spirochaetaceae bacterium]|nr:hypothetical protein [Spirochaetaceae bacterium]